jgi:hypothetical protein
MQDYHEHAINEGRNTLLRMRTYPTVWKQLQEQRSWPLRSPVVRFETASGVQARMDYATYTVAFTHIGPQRMPLFSYLLG